MRERRGGVLAESDLLAHVTSCVDAVISEADYQINSVAYQNLLVHISVAIMRIRENCYVPMESEHLRGIKGSREYPMAQAIAERIDRDLNVDLPEEEIAYIAIHLAGKQTLSIDVDDQGLVISDEVWAVVSEMLDCVWNVFRFDFRNDLELRMNLARHIVPLAVRLRYNMRLKNPLLADIRRRYPLAYSMACDASSVLAEHYDAKLSDDETGYIALAFALALEHQKTDAPRKNVLMVCASGAGSARLLEYRCRQEFGDFVGEITTCDVLDLGKVDFDRIDYVFTTVPLNRTLPVPVREVRHFLDPSDIEGVRDLFRVEKREDEDISRYFDRALFFPHLGLATKREVLDFLIKRVAEHRDVASNFAELVWKREATVATSFGNGVAMPHPLEPASEETFVCVAVLEEPVAWDEFGREVRVVFLSSFSAGEGLELQRFYSTLADMLVSRHAMATLEEGQDWETLMALLATFSQTAHATKNNPGGRPTFDSAMDGTDAMGSQKEQGR